MPVNHKTIDLTFIEAIYKELCGGILAEDFDNNTRSHASLYQFDPKNLTETDNALMASTFVKNVIASTLMRLRGHWGDWGFCSTLLTTMIVSSVKFGMLLQKRANEKSHLIT